MSQHARSLAHTVLDRAKAALHATGSKHPERDTLFADVLAGVLCCASSRSLLPTDVDSHAPETVVDAVYMYQQCAALKLFKASTGAGGVLFGINPVQKRRGALERKVRLAVRAVIAR